ncbi:MAG TPA: MFS transporter [Acidimicrobiia bacterium]|nr:MFS transporter [Acidimicrobiia bacterium]
MRPAKAITVASTATIVCAFPMMLTGALAVQMTSELGFGAAALGLVIAAFRGTSSGTTFLWGKATDRLGAVVALRLAAIVSAVSCAGVALSGSYRGLLIWMIIGGSGIAIALPATNRLIVNSVPQERRGLGFGIKQSSLPAASVLAGLSVPLIALTVGWRYAFWLGSVLSLIVLVSIGRRSPDARRAARERPKPPPVDHRALILVMAVAFGIGNFASSAMPAFYVDAAVRAGTSASWAGTVLAVAGLGAIAVRFVSGLASDRISTGHLKLCAALLAAGATGQALLATSRPTPMAIGLLIGMAGVWGVNGIFWYALMRAYPTTPGTATGVVATIGHAGGTLGPLVFGGIVQTASYAAAWWVSCFAAIAAATAMLLASRPLERTARPRDVVAPS